MTFPASISAFLILQGKVFFSWKNHLAYTTPALAAIEHLRLAGNGEENRTPSRSARNPSPTTTTRGRTPFPYPLPMPRGSFRSPYSARTAPDSPPATRLSRTARRAPACSERRTTERRGGHGLHAGRSVHRAGDSRARAWAAAARRRAGDKEVLVTAERGRWNTVGTGLRQAPAAEGRYRPPDGCGQQRAPARAGSRRPLVAALDAAGESMRHAGD